MKTIFTNSMMRTCFYTFVVLFSTLSLAGQTSHLVSVTDGSFTPKELTVTVGDTVIWTNNGANSHNVNGTTAKFPSNPESFGNEVGLAWTYKYVFNTSGTYDYQCDPHAIYGMVGKVIVNPQSEDPLKLTVNFTGMTPHVGQTLWLAVIDKATNMEIGRVEKAVDAAAFSIEVPGIEMGKSYNVDFFADHNGNGIYDTPPTDHAWRMDLNDVTGNSVLEFTHNTTFTDIAWKYKLTVHFTGMTPHLGEKLTLFLIWADTGFYHDTLVVPSVSAADFDIYSYEIKPGFNYSINFYADHNKNGKYDSPPTDHAWHIFLQAVKGDTVVNFTHNTNFTDILPTTSIPEIDAQKLRLYPNPANQFIDLLLPTNYPAVHTLKVYSITGSVVDVMKISENGQQLRYDLNGYRRGIYFMEINSENRKDVLKFIKQ